MVRYLCQLFTTLHYSDGLKKLVADINEFSTALRVDQTLTENSIDINQVCKLMSYIFFQKFK
jgi:hypothetical protein